jgi:hypothetical protein
MATPWKTAKRFPPAICATPHGPTAQPHLAPVTVDEKSVIHRTPCIPGLRVAIQGTHHPIPRADSV